MMANNLIGRAPIFGTFFLVTDSSTILGIPMVKRWEGSGTYIAIADATIP
jgi:hypothetical protein